MMSGIHSELKTDLQALQQAVAGDHQARLNLYQNFYPKLSRYAQNHFSSLSHDHEDLIQNVFVTLLQKPYINLYGHSVEGYLCGMLRNQAAQCIRSEIRREERERRAVPPETLPPIQNDLCEQKELAGQVRSAIDRLPEPKRSILMLACIQQLPLREISNILGLSYPSVQSHMKRGKLLLKNTLREVAR